MHRRNILAGAAAVLAASITPGFAQGHWPTKPITYIVPFGAGGTTDVLARLITPKAGAALGTSFVIENKPGAGGSMGSDFTAKAAPDGYTILMALSSFTVIPEADKLLNRAPTYAMSSLRPIARFTADPTVLAVRADAPWKTVKDFVDDAKKRPGAINYGSSGTYGTMHVPMEILAQSAGMKMTHVPFTGAGPAVVALMGGQIDAVSSGPATVLQQIKGGKLRALAHWGNGKLEAMPDVPSLKSAGYDAEYAQWSGLFIPAGTPEPIAQRLRAAAKFAANDPKVKQVILGAGSPVLYQDSPEFEQYVAGDAARMIAVVKKIGKVD